MSGQLWIIHHVMHRTGEMKENSTSTTPTATPSITHGFCNTSKSIRPLFLAELNQIWTQFCCFNQFRFYKLLQILGEMAAKSRKEINARCPRKRCRSLSLQRRVDRTSSPGCAANEFTPFILNCLWKLVIQNFKKIDITFIFNWIKSGDITNAAVFIELID